jgi:N-acetylmuramoyl-L-alanine amidase
VKHASGFAGRPASGVSQWIWAPLVCLLLAPVLTHAATHQSQNWAETQFNKAESQRETLNGRSAQARTRHEYQTVIASYRRIVFEAPTSSKADGSAFLVAELTAEMGRHFKDDMALYSAVREYKFLRREYPGSKHRVEALLAIGEIYKNDLGDDANARSTFEDFLRRYQHSELVKEARAELASLQSSPSKKDDRDQVEESSQNQSDQERSESADERTSSKIVKISAIKHTSTDDSTRITVDLDQKVRFESQRIDRPDRIFFDLKDARLASRLMGSSVNVDDGRVKKVRMAQFKPAMARIVIETDGHASFNASLMANPPRLVIDVQGNSSAGGTACADSKSSGDCSRDSNDQEGDVVRASEKSSTSSSDSLDSPAPKRVIVEADADDPPTDSTETPADRPSKPSGSSKLTRSKHGRTEVAMARPMREAQPTSDGDRSLIRTLGLKIGKIVIDPGHGGHDTGTIGPHGLLEKELVLDVSKRLGKLLSARLGAQVVYTRRDDTFIPLETRTAIANQEQADLFVSVHANSSRDPDARGVETYYLNFTSSPEALEVAARENAASDKSIHELQDLVKKIALKEKIEESREFASDVQGALHTGLAVKNPGERNRGVKKAPFVVLIGANMPSILAEISFLSNPTDERRLKTPEYRQRIAESLYRGISRYIDGLGGLKVASQIEKSSAD